MNDIMTADDFISMLQQLNCNTKIVFNISHNDFVVTKPKGIFYEKDNTFVLTIEQTLAKLEN